MFVALAIDRGLCIARRGGDELEGAEDREKLEVWMVIGWLSRNDKFVEGTE